MVQTVSNSNVMLNAKASLLATEKLNESSADAAKKTADKKAEENVDKFVKDSSTASSGVYKKPDKFTAEQLKAVNEQRVNDFQKMLTGMLGKQVVNFKKSTFDKLTVGQIGEADVLAAKKSIEAGGEWSPEKVSERILDMAKALSGGDASKFDLLKNAAIKGFGEAKKEWGDELPSITKETYKQTMKGFDDWKAELEGKTEEKEDTPKAE